MKPLKDISFCYFIGIGGIGMSALARYLQRLGKTVLGYDKTPTELTKQLEKEGIVIVYEDLEATIHLQLTTANTLVVYTPAIPKDSILLNYFISRGFEVVKRSRLLGEVTRDTLCLAVAGTHGKTTTSAILGHLMAASGMPVTAFLGGIAENYHSNFIHQGNTFSVVEADEFDRSFLQLQPDIACVTSMDSDHLDIYGDSAAVEASFKAFAALVKDPEKLLVKKGLPISGKTVAIEEAADFEARNVRIENGHYVFDLKTPTETIKTLKFLLPGHHNLLNAVTALGMAITAGTPTPGLPKALLSFKGVERRFSYKIKTEHLVLIDDYAHHPTEIEALFQAVSEMYPNDQKIIVFQPHLYSRTRDFAKGFAQSLSQFDEVVLLDLYPAREVPIPGVDSNWLLGQISNPKKSLIDKKNIAERIKNSPCKIKLMVGAGDIGAEVESVVKYLEDER
ncbi:MAG TPA: UDP-N-acetylmuramate--L-alanine ligase [Flavobacteriaceae bacterium]|nr:UDP-N-acetylmuramate--L-alanine ligase [Flavobacteriaceae bacterium]MCB9213086.1 UDP-N-acetylmuramate--L-alanine ligase [Alteromonas sp.]HPF10991.1 UDP-N-acetylmuramate--L-alanine ligase [Flavobacteriaceae bacterium]HQU20267.1 UDP-N-acetylmuramate--L-alanine ligase [Flavobacteriaceae bacterium]HQU64159.1 UDP-N-acetylmuramate--L-alanine ligase [Flavobacteriaceae bacterium]